MNKTNRVPWTLFSTVYLLVIFAAVVYGCVSDIRANWVNLSAVTEMAR